MPDVLDDDQQRALADAATLDWPRLRNHLADQPDVVAAILERRFENLYELSFFDQLWREINDESFQRDALAHPAVAAVAMRVVGAMAWHTPDAPRVHTVLRALPPPHDLDHLIAQVDTEIATSARFVYLRAVGQLTAVGSGMMFAFPDVLVRVFGARLLATRRSRVETMRGARTMFQDPLLLLAFCDRVAGLDPPLGRILIGRLMLEAPPDRASISLLPNDVHQTLGDRLSAIPPQSKWRRVKDIASKGLVWGPQSLARAIDKAQEPSADYTYRVRYAIALVMAELGIPLHVVAEWIAAHRRQSPQLDRHSDELRGDPTLQLFGVIVTVVHGYHIGTAPEVGPSPYR